MFWHVDKLFVSFIWWQISQIKSLQSLKFLNYWLKGFLYQVSNGRDGWWFGSSKGSSEDNLCSSSDVSGHAPSRQCRTVPLRICSGGLRLVLKITRTSLKHRPHVLQCVRVLQFSKWSKLFDRILLLQKLCDVTSNGSRAIASSNKQRNTDIPETDTTENLRIRYTITAQ